MIDFLSGATGIALWASQMAKSRDFVPPPPLLSLSGAARQYVSATVCYNGSQKADIWTPEHVDGAPVMVFVPGGAWLMGYRRPQGYALMQRLVEAGWICVAIGYRTSPFHRWPTHIEDVRDALNWTRENIANYGGDPNFVAVAGASAGGHMASLVGLNWERLGITRQPDAVVSLYGVYDWRPTNTPLSLLLDAVVVGGRQKGYRGILENASPIFHVRRDAPPFYIIHGDADWLTPVSGARAFYETLQRASGSTVDYEEIVGAGHAFDLTDATTAPLIADAIVDFLFETYEQQAWAVAS